MSGWLIAAAVLMVGGLAPCLWATSHGPPQRRLIGLDLASTVTCLVLLLLSQGYGRSSYVDLALVLALIAPAGSLVFARFVAHDQPSAAAERGSR